MSLEETPDALAARPKPRKISIMIYYKKEVCVRTVWRTAQFARSNRAKPHNRVANLSSPKKVRPCTKKPEKAR